MDRSSPNREPSRTTTEPPVARPKRPWCEPTFERMPMTETQNTPGTGGDSGGRSS
jgi:hypothetical protein